MTSDIREVPIVEIMVPADRELRSSPHALAESIRITGLINPITLTPDYTLITGFHRLEACRLLGKKTILARIVPATEVEHRMAEISENLYRTHLSVLDRAEQTYELRQLRESQQGSRPRRSTRAQVAARARVEEEQARQREREHDLFQDRSEAQQKLLYDQQMADRRREQYLVQIARDIPQHLRDQLRTTKLANNQTQLLQLARLNEEEEQEEIVELLCSGFASSVKEAEQQLWDDQPSEATRSRQKYRARREAVLWRALEDVRHGRITLESFYVAIAQALGPGDWFLTIGDDDREVADQLMEDVYNRQRQNGEQNQYWTTLPFSAATGPVSRQTLLWFTSIVAEWFPNAEPVTIEVVAECFGLVERNLNELLTTTEGFRDDPAAQAIGAPVDVLVRDHLRRKYPDRFVTDIDWNDPETWRDMGIVPLWVTEQGKIKNMAEDT